MGERGNRRNRFFLWLRNLKRQRKKKQEEEKKIKKRKEEERKKQQQIKTYSKAKVISMTVIGLFFGVVETILLPKKKEQQQFLQIEQKLESLQKETDLLKIEIKKEIINKIETKKEAIGKKETVIKMQAKQKEQQVTLEKIKKRVKCYRKKSEERKSEKNC